MILMASAMNAQKTDTIVHVNGNILTGDFKKMIYGVVTWKMDGMGTISLEEPKISTIISKKNFEVKTESGHIYLASFEGSTERHKVYLLMEGSKKLVNINEIVEAYPIKSGFLMRTSGTLSLGANYSKGSGVATVAFSGNFTYRKKRQYFNLSWDSNNTYQGDSLSARKSDIALTWQRSLNNGWSSNVIIAANQNLQLGTKLRISLNLSAIKDLAYNDWNRLYVGAGLNFSQETSFNDNIPKTNDIAGLFQVKWKVYKLTNPKIWLDADVSYLPYLTDPGRNRLSINVNPQVKVFSNNFKIGLQTYYSYDSKPTTEDASNDDYGMSLQLTYYYH